MSLYVGLLILVVLAIPLAIAIRRSNEVVVLDVENGRIRVRRGRIPQRMLSDLADVTTRPRLARATLKIVAEDGRPRLIAQGEMSDAQLQQLRNVVGLYRLPEIRNAPKR